MGHIYKRLEWCFTHLNHNIILCSVTPSTNLTSDTSGSWGCGAFCGHFWFQLSMDIHVHPRYLEENIATKELLPIVIAAAIGGPMWQCGKAVLCRCDNYKQLSECYLIAVVEIKS